MAQAWSKPLTLSLWFGEPEGPPRPKALGPLGRKLASQGNSFPEVQTLSQGVVAR